MFVVVFVVIFVIFVIFLNIIKKALLTTNRAFQPISPNFSNSSNVGLKDLRYVSTVPD